MLAELGVETLDELIDGTVPQNIRLDRALNLPEPRSESEGLDRSEHGEVGFDLGPALELAAEREPQEPRSAAVPPDGQRRFTVVVEGVKNGDGTTLPTTGYYAEPRNETPHYSIWLKSDYSWSWDTDGWVEVDADWAHSWLPSPVIAFA